MLDNGIIGVFFSWSRCVYWNARVKFNGGTVYDDALSAIRYAGA